VDSRAESSSERKAGAKATPTPEIEVGVTPVPPAPKAVPGPVRAVVLTLTVNGPIAWLALNAFSCSALSIFVAPELVSSAVMLVGVKRCPWSVKPKQPERTVCDFTVVTCALSPGVDRFSQRG